MTLCEAENASAMSWSTVPPSAEAKTCMPLHIPKIGIFLLYASETVRSSASSLSLLMLLKLGEGSSPTHKGLTSPPPVSNSPSTLSRVLIITSLSANGGIMKGMPPAFTIDL